MSKAKVVKTEFGWEVAFIGNDGIWEIQSGFALSTKAEAEAALRALEEADVRVRISERDYQAGYAYACGYYD